MLNDATGFSKVIVATGYTDLRRGIEGLATIIRFKYKLDPYNKNTLFLFCGKQTDRIKGLLWEDDGFLLLYKRLDIGGFSWPRTTEEALQRCHERTCNGKRECSIAFPLDTPSPRCYTYHTQYAFIQSSQTY